MRSESKLVRITDKASNLLIMTLIVGVSCLPLITIGASLIAALSVYVAPKNSYPFRTFWKTFKKQLGPGIVIEACALFVAISVYLNIQIAGTLSKSAGVLLLGVTTTYALIIFAYLFQLINRYARHENGKLAFYNALEALSVHPISSVVLTVANFFDALLIFLMPTIYPIWIMVAVWTQVETFRSQLESVNQHS